MESIRNILADPFFQFGGTLTSIALGWWFAYYYFAKSKEAKVIYWEMYSFLTGRKVRHPGETNLRSVVDTYIAIYNYGNQTIHSTDICDSMIINGDTQGLKGAFIQTRVHYVPSRHHQLSTEFINSRKIRLDIKLLRPQEVAIVVVRHSYFDCCVALEATTTVSGPAKKRTTWAYRIISTLQPNAMGQIYIGLPALFFGMYVFSKLSWGWISIFPAVAAWLLSTFSLVILNNRLVNYIKRRRLKIAISKYRKYSLRIRPDA